MMLTDEERIIGRLIQRDLAMARRPYREIAGQTGMTEQDVLNVIRQMLARGLIRKFGAVVRHREAGFSANAMVVWAVPEDRREQVGQMLASFAEITHCYERSPAFEGKYNLFSMIHLRNQDIEKIVEKIATVTGIQDYRILASEEEFKKSSMEYFA
ncbi:MAG: Lrp/AsnC family transcriptional regulator [Deltaproteobacteria bacterium HGW-Deltaproteobacteria-9]|nr:MAG: Lrp/AsnC family transcriptional regulator [Deltaproteobacteria bacterium HGW-Deltaproteobacteria-9]